MKKLLNIKLLNIVIPLIMLVILLCTNIGDNFIYIMTLTLIIGWLIPYLTLLLTGVCMYLETHTKLSLIINILNILTTLFIIILLIKIFEKSFIIILIEYIIIFILSIINVIILYKNINKGIKEYSKEIKKLKKENNGIIK